MNIHNILTKIDNLFLGIKTNKFTNTQIEVIKNYPSSVKNNSNNYKNQYKKNFEEICESPAELRFIKDESFGTEYKVQFLNKFISSNNSEWWTFPDWYSSGVTVDKLWSVYEKGGYGPYSSDVYEVRYSEIEYIKGQYKTMKQVYDYIMQIREKQLEWRERKQQNENLPNIIQ